MAGRGKEQSSAGEIRERVNRVMDAWQSYPDFAHLFSALLTANDFSHPSFAQAYSQATGQPLSSSLVGDLCQGERQPTYAFVSGIANHSSLLSLDSEKLHPGGQHRLALFSAAGLIEVTPDSIRHWNEEVLANLDRQRTLAPAQAPRTWRELMAKLLSFHCQGGRLSQWDIAAAMSAQPELNGQVTVQRCFNVINGPTTVVTRTERLALERIAGLDPSQIHRVETAVEDGSLQLGQPSHPSRFSALVDDILARLRAGGVSQTQLALRTVPPGQTEPQVSQSCLSSWKNGKTRPTQATLRAFVHALERCHVRANRPLVTPGEICQLVSAAGFTLDDLAATTHDIVRGINGSTRLKPLLAALRNAADLNVAMSAIDCDIARGQPDNTAGMANLLTHWENDGSPLVPSVVQVRELLTRYNRLLRAADKAELTEEEMQRVLEVAQRERQEAQQRGFRNRVREHHPRIPRRTIRPDFDGGRGS